MNKFELVSLIAAAILYPIGITVMGIALISMSVYDTVNRPLPIQQIELVAPAGPANIYKLEHGKSVCFIATTPSRASISCR